MDDRAKHVAGCKMWMDEYYRRLLNCSSTTGRRNNALKMKEIYDECEEVRKDWIYSPRCSYASWFKKRKVARKKGKEITIKEGLYLIGSTHFNPHTKEEFYWIKVGESSDVEKRLKSYSTHNPSVWRADFFEMNEEDRKHYEKMCHKLLKAVSLEMAENTKEWFRVSRETYLEICDKTWDYFWMLPKRNK